MAGPSSVAVFWNDSPLLLAILRHENTVLMRIDLRMLGLRIYDDLDGLHIGANVLAGNAFVHCTTAISLD